MPAVPSLTLLRSQSDERLVVLARAGHERAFEAIVERYRKPLHRACLRLLPHGRAEDALQQALLAAWTGLQRGDDVRELRPWLYRIVQNTALNALRASGYDHDVLRDSLEPGDAAQEELERRAVVHQTLAGLAALPERQREALLRTAVEGHSQKQVVRDLGLSSGAVQLVHRARVRLRAAATAVTPLPVAAWLASAGPAGAPMAERIGELGAVGAGAGAAATVGKAGAAAVLAGGVMAGQAAREDDARRATEPQRADRRPESRQSPHATWPPAAARTAPPAPSPSADSSRSSTRHATSHGSDRDRSSARDDPEEPRDDAGSRPPAAAHQESRDRPQDHDDEDRTERRRVPVDEEDDRRAGESASDDGDDDSKQRVEHESSYHPDEVEDARSGESEPEDTHTETSELAAAPPAPEEHEDRRTSRSAPAASSPAASSAGSAPLVPRAGALERLDAGEVHRSAAGSRRSAAAEPIPRDLV
jgi:RNA polymerase sigma factor (sigma-70 family)